MYYCTSSLLGHTVGALPCDCTLADLHKHRQRRAGAVREDLGAEYRLVE
jgi:hypothetical protein